MGFTVGRSWSVFALLALVGCAMPGPHSVRVGDSQAAVRGQLGAPAVERKLAGGNVAWYYPTGPSGFETWRVVFNAGGEASEYAQVLTAKTFVAMRDGVTRDAALDLVGPPMQRMAFPLSETEALTYRWRDGTLEMIADVVFDQRTGSLKYIGIYRDPAYASPPHTPR
jgi:hypothetical protein